MSENEYIAVADLIYDTDYDIYSDAFGDKKTAHDIIPALIKKPGGLFSYENIRIAKKDEEIVGVIVFAQNRKFSLDINRKQYKNLPDSFEKVNELYFEGLAEEYEDKKDLIYAACICVHEDVRGEKIGAMLLDAFVKEYGNHVNIYLDIVAENERCINMCTNEKYGFGLSIIKRFEDYKKGGTMDLPCVTLFRPKTEQKKRLTGTPKKDGFRMPAEFEEHEGCWLLWPERTDNWRLDAKPAQEAFARVAKAIAQFENVSVGASSRQYGNARTTLPADIRVVEISSADAWARDTGPTFVKNDEGIVRAVDWEFNAYGGFVDGSYFPWHLDDQVAHKICEIERKDVYRTDGFVLEGGSIHTDGEGTLYTTEECLLSKGRNPHMTKKEIEDTLKEYLGVDRIIWLKRGIYDDVANGHVDNILCVVKPGVVMLAWTEDENDPQYEISMENLKILEEATDAKGRKLEIIKMMLPKPTFITEAESSEVDSVEGVLPRSEGDRLSASYINFYIANNGIVFPLFNDPNDELAEKTLNEAFPDRKIVGVESRDILLGGGNIHCIVQQQPK